MTQYVPTSVWYYAPNKAAAIVFIILFLISGIWHTFQTIRYKSWRVTLLLPWAAILIMAGFAVREAGAYNIDNLNLLIASTVLIMSGPPVYAASNYLVLSRVLFYVPYLSPMHPGRVLTTFLGIDGIIEGLISNGAARMTNSSLPLSERKTGITLVKVSLVLQAVMFFVFLLLAATFHVRAVRAGVLTSNLRTVLIVLYVTSLLVTVRCIYRIVEFFEGWDGTISSHEPYFWVFEAALMFLVTLTLNLWHPGRRLPRSNKVYLSQDGHTERRGLGWGDDRNWLVTCFDPMDLMGLCTGRDKRTKFWEMSPEEIERIEEQRKLNKRPWWCNALDPLHLHGSKGLIAKWKQKQRHSPVENMAVMEEHANYKARESKAPEAV